MYLALFTLILMSFQAAKADNADSTLDSEELTCSQRGQSFRATDRSLMMSLRANGCHYWLWARSEAPQILPESLLKHTGFVAGDPHHENFSHMTINGRRLLVLNDLDDTGEAPMFLDYLKLTSVSRAALDSERKLSSAKALQAYSSGLKGESWNEDLPEFLQDDFELTEKELQKMYIKEIKRHETDGEFNKAPDVTPWRSMSESERFQFTAFENDVSSQLPRGYKIKDRGIYRKSGGGSGGVQRYWFYLKRSDSERHFIEFKPLVDPAVGNYQAQASNGGRLDQATKSYWSGQLPDAFGVVTSKGVHYWMRPRYPTMVRFSLSDFKDQPKAFAELTYYLAFRLGHWHGTQSGAEAYVRELTALSSKLVVQGDQFIAKYLRLAESESSER